MNAPQRDDPFSQIEQLKREKNAVILAHYYQDPDIQDVADFVGDSLELARAAQRSCSGRSGHVWQGSSWTARSSRRAPSADGSIRSERTTENAMR